MTIPGAVMSSLFYARLQSLSNLGNLIITIGDSITFTFHSLNFSILLFTNKRFARELKKYLGKSFQIFNGTIINSASISNRIGPSSTRENKLF
jgi:hypothetical protein